MAPVEHILIGIARAANNPVNANIGQRANLGH
jgi:hypothetical protein